MNDVSITETSEVLVVEKSYIHGQKEVLIM